MSDSARIPRAWPEVERWRFAERERLLAVRSSVRRATRVASTAAITRVLRDLTDLPPGAVIGCYWPYRGEIDPRPLLREQLARGARLALPAVVVRNRPLEYRNWHPGEPLELNALGIPVPARREPVVPDVILAPLLGFDDHNHRLGLGGGYFDRTLAALEPRPWTIGVGFEVSLLASIHPQAHDVPMDVIVTEAGMQVRPRSDTTGNGPGPTLESGCG